MKLLRLAAWVLFVCNSANAYAAPAIAGKLGKISDSLTAAYGVSAGAKEKPSAAVFTFNTSKELEKMRIGFAVSEMLSHQLAKSGKFQLLERTELNRVLGELKLSLSGVTEQEDAISAGKLARADMLVMGSVEKMGKSYHVNARLVNAETGEVVATAYESLPISAFEEEAKDYVVMVPKTQTIGIYFLGSYRVMAKVPSTTNTYPPGWVTYITTNPERSKVMLPGFGIRYAPFEHFLIDVAYMNSAASKRTGNRESDNAFCAGPYTSNFSMFRAVAGPKGRLFDGFSYSMGVGATVVSISRSGQASYTTPTALAGFEFRPQQRLGLAVSVGYDFVTKTAMGNQWGAGDAYFKITRLPHFYLEPSLALYF